MADQLQLRPFDIPVALRLVEHPERTFPGLSEDLGISLSTAHAAVERLRQAGLLYQDVRRINHTALLEFLEHGVRYAFPAQMGSVQSGVPTGYAGPDLANDIVASQAVVWADPDGSVVGPSITPLFPQATTLPERCPGVYAMLSLVDAIRMGRVRERQLAVSHLRARFSAARQKSVA